MTELRFSVLDIAAEPYAAVPTLLARLRVEEGTGEPVHAVVLRAQVRIEAQRRGYDDREEAGLLDLFDRRERWADTLRPLLWMHATAMVPGFTGATEVDLPLPCTYDFEVTGAKYLQALRDGEIPLLLLYSGTVFTRGTTGFAVTQIPWSAETSHRLPVAVWRTSWTVASPAASGCAWTATPSRRWRATNPPAVSWAGTTPSNRCWRRPR